MSRTPAQREEEGVVAVTRAILRIAPTLPDRVVVSLLAQARTTADFVSATLGHEALDVDAVLDALRRDGPGEYALAAQDDAPAAPDHAQAVAAMTPHQALTYARANGLA